MRAAIIAPPYPLAEAPSPSLGVSYVASAFEQAGADVLVIDYIVQQYTPDKLKRTLDEFQPDIIGSTAVTMNFPVAAKIMTEAKKVAPHAVAIMGGPHVSFDVVNTLKTYGELDFIVIGEGEATIREMVDQFRGGGNWTAVKGIAFRRNGEIVMTGHRDLITDLDTLPLPARHLLPLSRYRALGFPVTMITSRGCPYSCIFCLGRRMVGSKPRRRKASLVVDEMEHILSYGFTRINIADDLFTADKEKVRDVCEEIRRRKLKIEWTAFARVNTVDKDTLVLMRETGCDCISFGIESGNPAMLKRVKKGITLEQARNAVDLCKETGIMPHASFMVGLPGETPDTLNDTAAFSKSLDVLYGYHFLAPFPGTTVREKIDEYDLEILTDDWSRYDANSAIVRTSALTPEAMNTFVAEYDREFEEAWEKMVEGYINKTNTPEDDLRVAGHFRMKLVYQILSEDLLEKCGNYPIDNGDVDVPEAIRILSKRIEQSTASDFKLIYQAIQNFVDSGYIKYKKANDRLSWYWTHNNKLEHYPS
ncbi:MAG: cobalamin-dependent protein [Deltaproteobacteria bacterium]|nr:cobalamin-dependent protein [Deltaproteobacteria bacterium]